MRLSSPRLGLAATLSAALAGCSSAGASSSGIVDPPHPPPDGATVRFDAPGTLALAPGVTANLGVVGAPAADYAVGFALLGQPLDGWIDPPTVTADAATGHAIATLHAPSQATTFHVRASLLDEQGVPGASADRAVAVSEQGFGSIRVVPAYAGSRPITEWTASAVANATCKDVAGLPEEPAGALTATAPGGGAPIIENAPVGPAIAVMVRAGHFATGCADVSTLTPGGEIAIGVTVADKPLDLAGANLAATFSWGGQEAILAPILAHASAALGEAFIPSGGKDGAVVLNAMAALVPASNAAAFTAQRINKGWDAIAATHFAAQSPNLRQQLELWAAAGLAGASPEIAAILAPSGTPGQASCKVTGFGGLDPEAAGVVAGALIAWSAQPKDQVLLAGAVAWQPTRFAGAAALGPAQQDFPGAASMGDALASAADCAGLAAQLGSFGTCDTACVQQLCAAALGARFGAAEAQGMPGQVAIQASGAATAGDAAQPVALSGYWVGKFTDGVNEATIMGSLTATTP